MKDVSVIGLGKLGLCIAACLADKGYRVTGIDVDKKKIEEINGGNNPIEETGLTELIKKCTTNLKVTNDYYEAVKNSQITFVVVATPSEADGSFSNEQLEETLKKIAKVVKEKDKYHLVVITSTVMPGTTERVAKFILESVSGKECGVDFGLAYNPEFIALGSVIHDFLNPDFILIGETNERDGKILEEMYKKICENNPPIARISPINAEIAKIALNCYITMKITFANSLASLCEQVEGADADVITNAIGMDSRIGRKYLKGGLGYGGPCFPRDNLAFGAFVKKVGLKPKLAETVDEVNRNQVKRIVGIAKSQLRPKSKVSILGLSYKHLSPVIEDSQAIDIAESLLKDGYRVAVYDPMALENAQSVFGEKVDYADSVEDCLKDSELCIITTRWEEFKPLDGKMLKKNMKKAVVLDCWRLIEKNDLQGVKYIALGRGSEQSERSPATKGSPGRKRGKERSHEGKGGVMEQRLSGKRILVTGGASFIGSHLVDALIDEKPSLVRVVDNLSSGRLENIQGHIDAERVEFHKKDLLAPGVAQEMVKKIDVVFHLAADHGGRGYVDLHQAACATNLALDGLVIKAAYEAGVEKFVFASSGCVYPDSLQTNPDQILYLEEEMVDPPYEADKMYGWAKLMAELTLKAYYKDYGMKSVSCRLFTVYGERGVENHAVIAMIARAFVGQNPFPVWGTGEQIRNWTHVSDIVSGMILAAKKIEDATAINLGTMERIKVIDAVKEVLSYTGHKAKIELHPEMPTGPYNRVADNSSAKKLLGWEPKVKFMDGLHKTIDWYFTYKNKEEVLKKLDYILTER